MCEALELQVVLGVVPVRVWGRVVPRRTPPERSPSRRRMWSSSGSRTAAWTRSSPSPEAWPSQHDPHADTCSAGRSSWKIRKSTNERLRLRIRVHLDTEATQIQFKPKTSGDHYAIRSACRFYFAGEIKLCQTNQDFKQFQKDWSVNIGPSAHNLTHVHITGGKQDF